MLPCSCAACYEDPELKEVWGCEEPTSVACWGDDEDQYYSCPFKFIPESILEWYQEYCYIKEFQGTALPFYEQGEKWIMVSNIYSRFYNAYIDEIQKKRLSKMNAGANHGRS